MSKIIKRPDRISSRIPKTCLDGERRKVRTMAIIRCLISQIWVVRRCRNRAGCKEVKISTSSNNIIHKTQCMGLVEVTNRQVSILMFRKHRSHIGEYLCSKILSIQIHFSQFQLKRLVRGTTGQCKRLSTIIH